MCSRRTKRLTKKTLIILVLPIVIAVEAAATGFSRVFRMSKRLSTFLGALLTVSMLATLFAPMLRVPDNEAPAAAAAAAAAQGTESIMTLFPFSTPDIMKIETALKFEFFSALSVLVRSVVLFLLACAVLVCRLCLLFFQVPTMCSIFSAMILTVVLIDDEP